MARQARALGAAARRLRALVGVVVALGILAAGLYLATAGYNAARTCTLHPGGAACHGASSQEFYGIILVVAALVTGAVALVGARASR